MLQNRTFADLFAFTRASGATGFGAAGNLAELAVDTIRQSYDPATLLPAGWLLEAQSTNLCINPRFEGATVGVVGSGGVRPSSHGYDNLGGLTEQVVGVGTFKGRPYYDVRLFGTSTTAFTVARFVPYAAPFNAGVGGVSYAHRFPLMLVGGSLSGLSSITCTIRATGTGLSPGSVNFPLGSLNAADWTFPPTLVGVTAAGTTTVAPGFSLNYPGAGTVVDVTLRIGAPMTEQGPRHTSLVLPTVGTPAQTVRAADLLVVAPAGFAGLFGNAAQGFLVADVLLPQAAPTGLDQIVAQLDDGTDNNRLVLRNLAGGLTVSAEVWAGGASLGNTSSAGSAVVGTAFRVGLKWGAGAVAVCMNGGALQTLAATLPTVTGLQLGNRRDLARPLSGWLRGVWGGSLLPSDAKFQAACVAGADLQTVLWS